MAVAAGTGASRPRPARLAARHCARAEGDVARHLVADVLPSALLETALLLGGVAVVAGAIGIGTAWLVTAHDFPSRRLLAWLLPLPLAVPTYITAYVYVELLDAAGPVQTALRGLMGWRLRGDYWFPEMRSLGGCMLVMSFVLYPYVYITARAMFLTQSAAMLEVARTLGASRWELFRTVAVPLARPALAVGLSLALLEALNDIGATEYLGVRTLTVSVFTTWLNRGSLPAAAQIACVMLAVVVGAHPARAPRAAEPPLCGLDAPRPGGAAGAPRAAARDPGCRGLRAPRAPRLRRPGGFPRRRGRCARARRPARPRLPAPSGHEPRLAAGATVAALALAVVVVTTSRFARHALTDGLRPSSGSATRCPAPCWRSGCSARSSPSTAC